MTKEEYDRILKEEEEFNKLLKRIDDFLEMQETDDIVERNKKRDDKE